MVDPDVRRLALGSSAAGISRLRGLLTGLDQLDTILSLPEHPAAVEPGLRFGRYFLRSRLGAGRFGVVLLAEDPVLGRRVVV
jgi:hypothetical protein